MRADQKERLVICSSCINRKLDFEMGYVCGLTGEFAEFKKTCKDHVRDDTVTDLLMIRTEERPMDPLFDPVPVQETEKSEEMKGGRKRLSPEARKKRNKHQSFFYALTGGSMVAMLVALAWAYTSDHFGFNSLYMAPGAGLLIGLAVRYFGAGFKWIFGILAAVLTLVASILGYYLGQTGLFEEVLATWSLPEPDSFHPQLMFDLLRDDFVPLDLIYSVLAVILSYILAIRRMNRRIRARLEGDDNRGAPFLYRFRLPFILLGILIPAYFGYTLSEQETVESMTFNYESGKRKSEGKMRNGLESGLWTEWYESGNLKYKGFFKEGEKDSIWMEYHQNGVLSDSGAYLDGQKHGVWKVFFENGRLRVSEIYENGKLHGKRTLLSPSGKIVTVRHFENGVEVDVIE